MTLRKKQHPLSSVIFDKGSEHLILVGFIMTINIAAESKYLSLDTDSRQVILRDEFFMEQQYLKMLICLYC